ncbi:hypothetical protein pEaSNUABM29_00275 [Erwinia phage pEa_SNUABM_29]|nr:hypothetical protein pEaSNUABM29_00275 [Erwinia phage pEa_SNUABM_29]
MAKTLQEVFIDMVNAKNPDLNLALSDVVVGKPTPYTPTGEGDTRNSSLTLIAKDDSPNFKGTKEYHFTRFSFTNPPGEDVYSTATTDAQVHWDDDAYVLNLINMMLPNYKLDAAEALVTRGEMQPDVGDGPFRDIKLKINPNHLKWTGAYVWRVYSGKDNLQWKNGELNGFS